MRRMSAGSVRCAISPLVSNSGAENAPVCASRFLLWRRNCTPSTDSNITSASLARTGVQSRNVTTMIRKCNHNIHSSSVGDVGLCTPMFARIVSKLTGKVLERELLRSRNSVDCGRHGGIDMNHV